MWQISKFLIHKEFPPVEQLAIYLFEEQLVYFNEDVLVEQLQEKINGT